MTHSKITFSSKDSWNDFGMYMTYHLRLDGIKLNDNHYRLMYLTNDDDYEDYNFVSQGFPENSNGKYFGNGSFSFYEDVEMVQMKNVLKIFFLSYMISL